MADSQTMALGNRLETLVVIGVASARVLDAVDMAVVMHHLMQQRCADVFDWPCERTGSDIDFVTAAGDRNPCIVTHGEVPVSPRRGLDGDGRS